MTFLKCQHCGYVWDYKGAAPYRAGCPSCGYKVTIHKAAILEGGQQQIGEMKRGKPLGSKTRTKVSGSKK